jgi:hypothetical protein
MVGPTCANLTMLQMVSFLPPIPYEQANARHGDRTGSIKLGCAFARESR